MKKHLIDPKGIIKIIIFIIGVNVLDIITSILLNFTHFDTYWIKLAIYKYIELIFVLLLNRLLFKQKFFIHFGKRQIFVIGTVAIIIGLLAYKDFQRTLFALVIGLGAALPEEAMFRGVLIPTFIKNINTKSPEITTKISLFFVSAIFGLIHLVNLTQQDLPSTLLQVIQAFFLGYLIGAIYIAFGNLLNTILFHFVLDFLVIFRNNTIITHVKVDQTTIFGLVEGCVIYFAIATYILKRKGGFKNWKLVDKVDSGK